MNYEANRSDPLLSPGWFWYGVLPLLPFLTGAIFLQVIAPPYFFSDSWNSLRSSVQPSNGLSGFANLGDRLVFLSAAMLQCITCLGVFTIHMRLASGMSSSCKRTIYRQFALTMLVAFIVCVWIRSQDAAVYEFSFKLVRELLLASPGWGSQFANSGFFLGQSRTFWLAFIPFLLGAINVAFIPAVYSVGHISADRKNTDWQSGFSQRLTTLQNSFRLSSLVLVTSAIALMLFVKMPLRLMNDAGREAYGHFALGLPVFWGAIMTLTLLMGFAPLAWSLAQEAKTHYETLSTEKSFNQWLVETQNFSIKRHLANLATILAPVMVGPVGSLLQTVLG